MGTTKSPVSAFSHFAADKALRSVVSPLRQIAGNLMLPRQIPLPLTQMAAPPSRPLRIVRVVEGAQSRSSAGRMTISGRMADVCAELERMAA